MSPHIYKFKVLFSKKQFLDVVGHYIVVFHDHDGKSTLTLKTGGSPQSLVDLTESTVATFSSEISN